MIRIVIAGSRKFSNQATLDTEVDKFIDQYVDTEIQIISGGAKGADKMGEIYAKKRGYDLKIFPTKWDLFGKKAGYLRNEEMAKNADAVIAFWDGNSPGTKHIIRYAEKLGLDTHLVKITTE